MIYMTYANSTDVYDVLDMTPAIVSSTTIEYYVTVADSSIRNEFGTAFISTTSDAIMTTEAYDGSENFSTVGSDVLVLDNYPIVELSTVSIDGNNVTNTSFIVRTDRIFVGTEAPVSTFGTTKNGVRVGYKYGAVDVDKARIARELNAYMAALDFMRTPRGRDAVFDNSRYAAINHNDVRPNDMVALYIGDMQAKIDELKGKLGHAHKFF